MNSLDFFPIQCLCQPQHLSLFLKVVILSTDDGNFHLQTRYKHKLTAIKPRYLTTANQRAHLVLSWAGEVLHEVCSVSSLCDSVYILQSATRTSEFSMK